MSFRGLQDHTVEIWRPVETEGALRTVVETFARISTGRAATRRPSAVLGDTGPGLTPIGRRTIYMTPGWDVRLRDVVKFLTGPDAPGRFEVDEPPTRPRGHHLEIRARYFAGKLPGDT